MRTKTDIQDQALQASVKYIIGIDPGTKTGLAAYDVQKNMLVEVSTYMIHQAMHEILELNKKANIFVRVEDARLRKWYGEMTHGKEQGAGSIKRDCSIWDDFLTDNKIPFEMVHPLKSMTKINEVQFRLMTGFRFKTSSHGRDAAMLCYKFKLR